MNMINHTARSAATKATLLAFTALAITSCNLTADTPQAGTRTTTFEATVDYVVDGDTLNVRVDGTSQRIRILGIDAPETKACGGTHATEQLQAMLPKGSTVTIEFDPTSDQTDNYNRFLAYVSTDTDPDIGHTLIITGAAAAWWPRSAPTPTRADDYLTAEAYAHKARAGAWERCTTIGRSR